MSYGPQPGFPGQPTGFPGQPTGLPGQSSGFPGQPTGFPGQSSGFPGQPTGAAGRSPLPRVAGILSLLSALYFVYCAILLIFVSSRIRSAEVLAGHTLFLIVSGIGYLVLMSAFLVIAIMQLIGAVLLFRNRPGGRIMAAIPGFAVFVSGVFTLAQYLAVAQVPNYLIPVLGLIVAILCLLPAMGRATRGSTGFGLPPMMPMANPYQPGQFPQQQFPGQQVPGQPGFPAQQGFPPQQPGYPSQQPGYPPQQPPTGY
ncbi:MAG TPA: hypothetical protein VHX38_33610 [Pseudonocardiaceae bacterium]|jgi:hypothetical protein|nr:hypothetical protein [Pseudonocardiaceae bacterium]